MSVTTGPNWKVDWKADQSIGAAIDYAWPIACREVKDRAAANAPKKTGALSRSMKLTVQKRSATLIAQVPYSLYVEKGTRAHDIHPTKSHGLLVFEIGGETVFVKGPVHHPGTRAQPFLMPATQILPLRFAAALRTRLR
jgi:hypothetical protein